MSDPRGDSPEINSKAYWDRRFAEDWDINLGREQSRFFARLALKLTPSWLGEAIRGERWSLCDWGCAEGDGTRVFAEAFPDNRVVGIDFSDTAVASARALYGDGFLAEDWMAESDAPGRWDLVISSNTLEHFPNPAEVLARLCARADKGVMLLLPYKELERHPEHEVTFLPSNIPLIPSPGMMLCFAASLDAALEEPSYWGGEQVLLVYLRSELAASMGLSAQEAVLCLSEGPQAEDDRRGQAAKQLALAELKERLFRLQTEHLERQDQIETLAAEVRSQHAHSVALAEEVGRQDAKAQELAVEVRRQHALIQGLNRDLAMERERSKTLAEEAARESANAFRYAQRCAEAEGELAALRSNPLRLLFKR